MKKNLELKVLLITLAAYLACTAIFFVFSFYQIRSKDNLKKEIEQLELEVAEFNRLDTIRSQVFYLFQNNTKDDFNNDYRSFWTKINRLKTNNISDQIQLDVYYFELTLTKLPEFKVDYFKKTAKFNYDARYLKLKEKYSINSKQDFYQIVNNARFHSSDLDVFWYIDKKKKELSKINPSSNKLFVFDYWLDFLLIFSGLLSIRYLFFMALFIKRKIPKLNFKGFYSKNKIPIVVALLVLFLSKPDSRDFEEMGYYVKEKKFDAIIFNCYETDEGICIGILGNVIKVID